MSEQVVARYRAGRPGRAACGEQMRDTYSSPGLGGSIWPCANDEDTENGRTVWMAATRFVFDGRLVARLIVEELHDLD